MSKPESLRSFSEREFYLGEFRGRSIGIAWPVDEKPTADPLAAVIAELVANGSRVVVLGASDPVFEVAGIDAPGDGTQPDFAPRLWRVLRETGCAGLRVPTEDFESACTRVAVGLRLAKLVWIRSRPPVERLQDGGRVSVVDLAHLEALLAADETETAEGTTAVLHRDARPLLAAIRSMIEGGVPAVNVCAPQDLVRELFTYAGAGTFFTRDRYAEVRPLALDDYDLANDLIERGEADGFLAPRDAAARDAVLAHGVGVFIEGRYLAGIGAILPHAAHEAVEIACLFALTRYIGEGVGTQIVRYAIERAEADGLAYLFGCTTSERVERFFLEHGFRRVSTEEVPPEKWLDYEPARRQRVRCLRYDCRR